MVPGRLIWIPGFKATAALLLLVGLCPWPSMAQAPAAAPVTKQTAPAPDPATIGIVGGSPEGSTLSFVGEIARVLARGQETGPNGELALRILPVVGRGGVHDVRDILSLPGVDMGIVPEHVLARLQKSKELGDLKVKLVYVTKLFSEELHIIARTDIRQLSDLSEKPVNLGDYGSGAEEMARDLFSTLGLDVSEVHLGQDEALEEMRQGRVAATAFLASKPAAFVERLTRDGGFHLLPVPVSVDSALYLPASLRHEDYPNLVPEGESVETAATGTVLIAYRWPEKSRRHQLLGNFVDAFFSRFSEFHAAARHPKWRDVNLAVTVPGWERFKPAERWVQRSQAQQAGAAVTGSVARPGTPRRTMPEEQTIHDERLFQEFLEWREQRGRR